RERVNFARTFLDQIAGTNSSVTESGRVASSKQNFWAAIRHWFSVPKVAFAGAMGVVVVLVGVWMFSLLFAPGGQDVVFQSSNDAQVPPASTRSPEAVASVSPTDSTEMPEPTANAARDEQLPIVKETPVRTQTPAIEQPVQNAVLALFPGNLRSGGSNKVLRLPNNARVATFILNLPSTVHSTYSASVTDADGSTIAQFNNLRASKGRIRLVVGADQLKKGDFLIRLDGKYRSGENESVADFQFRIDR
ncbi:MAG: hypothetical protein AB7J13_12735, partial [Pyrinomonadaceae bacterium]